MDFESPDVEKEFPGLYASESGRKSNESDFSEGGDHDKPSKLLGRRKDKKEKKDRGYAALEGESSPEEDTDAKSPSKSKKTKSFKFPTKSKEKREKSRDKEKVLEDAVKHKEHNDKEKKKEKEKEKEKKEKEKKLKEKDKMSQNDIIDLRIEEGRTPTKKNNILIEQDALPNDDTPSSMIVIQELYDEKEEKAKFKLESKEKLKDEKKEKSKDKEKVKDKDKEKVKDKDREKIKDKDKKDKKLAKVPSTVTAGIPFEEIFTLGVALPIFGVSLQQSVERSRCHDDTCLPLVVRDSIDYLQEHGLKSPQIYRPDVDKVKLQQLRKLYTDRGSIFPYHWDVPVACAILKNFLSELPESILTQELHTQFEQSTAMAEPQREAHVHRLIAQLPKHNHTLLGWLVRHFGSVLENEQHNHMNVQSLSSVMCPALNMSQSLFTYLVKKADHFFPDVELTKYVPPLVSLPVSFPPAPLALSVELRKQESLLAQVHAEMHAGFTSPTRDQQLWEAQRIVTQLKRKLRSLQKSVEPQSLPPQQSVEEKTEDEPQPTLPVTETATDTITTSVEPEKRTVETISVTEVAKSVEEAFRPIAEPFKPIIEPFKPVIEPFQPVTEPFKPVIDSFKPVAEPFKPVIDSFKPVAEPFKPVIDSFKPVAEPFKPVTEPIKPFLESPKPNEAVFPAEFDDNFDVQPTSEPKHSTQEAQVQSPPKEKPKLTETELEKLRLELENAEYQQLKSLLQAKINSEKFEIVKLKSQIALKSKQNNSSTNKENKDAFAIEDEDLKQQFMKENALLEQKRNAIINQIFEERVACIQLKIELAMKDLI